MSGGKNRIKLAISPCPNDTFIFGPMILGLTDQQYGLTKDRYDRLKDSAIVMHPAPVNRDVELADECVEAKKSRIVEQMRNGVFMRMAILENILESRGELR